MARDVRVEHTQVEDAATSCHQHTKVSTHKGQPGHTSHIAASPSVMRKLYCVLGLVQECAAAEQDRDITA